MSLVLAGIDEAGFGPTLGPLCVGLAVFRVCEWANAETTPNLWTLLKGGVCREPGRGGKADAKGRVAVADSKKLKLANSVRSAHPLVHLERGVLSFVRATRAEAIETDVALHRALGTVLPGHACYGGEPIALPLGESAGQLAIASSMVARALEEAGVELVDLRCTIVGERDFNAIIRERGNKGETTISALAQHLRHVWTTHAGEPETRVGIVCDRLGGRESYAPILERELAGSRVEVVEQTEARSRYIVTAKDARRAGVAFLTEGEDAHLPVALASMAAKYVRELAMARFNRYFAARARERGLQELKPTAGYALDARRWLDEAGMLLSREDRDSLVRIA